MEKFFKLMEEAGSGDAVCGAARKVKILFAKQFIFSSNYNKKSQPYINMFSI